jgi:GTPase SAR1 family protein
MLSTKCSIEELKVILGNLTFFLIGAVIVFDCSEPTTFKRVATWATEVRSYVQKEIPIIIAANKSDLITKDKSLIQEGRDYATKNGFSFFECSARAGKNITELFQHLAVQI